MKILQVVSRIPFPLNDGGNIATWQLANHLGKSGQEMQMAALNTLKHYQDPSVLNSLVGNAITETIDTTLSPWKAIQNLSSPLPYIVSRFVSPTFEQKLIQHIQLSPPDIIQLEGLYVSPYLNAIQKVFKGPIVYRAHNLEFLIWERLAHSAKGIKKWYLTRMAKALKSYEQKFLRQVSAVLVFTQEDANLAQKLGYLGKMEIIPAGVDTQQFYGSHKDPIPNSIGFLGSLDWLPNQEAVQWFVKKVLPKIKEKIPEVKFRVAGRNPPKHWTEWANQEGWDLIGPVPEALHFLHSNSIFVVPLKSGGGMRLKILEAQASGIPVLTTSVGLEGISMIPDLEVMVGNSPEELSEKAIVLLQNPELRKKMAQQALLKIKETYDWQVIAQKTILFYNSLN
jgi:glycosyltransferase involved in cell wall biosynthesis